MNITPIAKLAQTHPALARLAEASMISGLTYVLGAIIDQEILSWHALIVAVITPIYLALTKYNRDRRN